MLSPAQAIGTLRSRIPQPLKVDAPRPKQMVIAETRKHQREVYSTEEMTRFLCACNPTCFDGHRMRTVIALMWRTGLRACEIVRLRTADLMLQLKRPQVRVFWGKKRNQRSLGLDADMVAELRSWLAMRQRMLINSGCDPEQVRFVFPTKLGNSWQPSNIRRAVRTLGVRIKLGKRAHPHGFRHTFANDCVARGLQLTTIQHMMGHRSLQYTQVYIREVTALPAALDAGCTAPSWRDRVVARRKNA